MLDVYSLHISKNADCFLELDTIATCICLPTCSVVIPDLVKKVEAYKMDPLSPSSVLTCPKLRYPVSLYFPDQTIQ